MIRPPKLYGIADGDALGVPGSVPAGADDPLTPAVVAMAEAGVRWIQIRLKSCDDRTLYRLVERATRAIEGSRASLWIDDRADVAACFRVAGVHVGQNDLPPSAARRVLATGRASLSTGPWIGVSCHDEAHIRRADQDPDVDVVACGPVFETRSKAHPDPVIGLDGVRAARAATAKPLVAIGGIDLSSAPRVLEAGADTVVVLGALCRGDVARNSRRWVAALEDDANESS